MLRGAATLNRRFKLPGHLLNFAMRVIQPSYPIGTVGVLFDETHTRVLLVEHVFHADYPWGLPGGWLNRGEDPADAVVRELREETGLRVRVLLPLIAERGHDRRHMVVRYWCELIEWPQTITLCDELLDYRWAALDDLAGLIPEQVRAIKVAAALYQGGLAGSELTKPLGEKTEDS